MVEPGTQAAGGAGKQDPVAGLVRASEAMGLTILRAMPAGQGNVLGSPAGLAGALAVLGVAARGRTAEQIDAVLGGPREAWAGPLASLRRRLTAYEAEPGALARLADEAPAGDARASRGDGPALSGGAPVSGAGWWKGVAGRFRSRGGGPGGDAVAGLHLAGQVLVDRRVAVADPFRSAVAGLGVELTTADLAAPETSETLDAWVREHTGGLIDRSALELGSASRLAVQDALLFGAHWAVRFEPASTEPAPFAIRSGERVDVSTMRRTGPMPYAASDGWRAVRLAYVRGFYSDVILPPPGVDPVELDERRYRELTTALANRDAARRMWLELPRADLRRAPAADLRDPLAALGLAELFDHPDLTGVGVSDVPLVVGQALQRVVLRVTEQGTVMAALTEIGVRTGAALDRSEPEPFIVDRPYLLTICDAESGWPLMMSLIGDPRG